MTFVQAIGYFIQEATLNLVRSSRISLLAVVTVAVSLYVGGLFWLCSTNLADHVADWRARTLVTAFLTPDAAPDELAAARRLAAEPVFIHSVTEISAEQARDRFERAFPDLSELTQDRGVELPPALEIQYDPAAYASPEFSGWIAALEASPATSQVDDDREFLAEIEDWLRLVRTVGLSLAAVLLAAAVLTTASVIRLTAYIHRDEISVMRLVGATEFFIRGPFYVEGFLQGVFGSLVALAALALSFHLAGRGEDSVLRSLLLHRFLRVDQALELVALGGLAGLTGALLSLRREVPQGGTAAEEP
jgi:cell division transport system permease protein